MEAVSTQPTTSHVSRHAGKYRKVLDGRKQRIRGLWERNRSYYGQLTVDDSATGQKIVKRVRLEDQDGKPVSTAAEAVKRLKRPNTIRRENVCLRVLEAS